MTELLSKFEADLLKPFLVFNVFVLWTALRTPFSPCSSYKASLGYLCSVNRKNSFTHHCENTLFSLWVFLVPSSFSTFTAICLNTSPGQKCPVTLAIQDMCQPHTNSWMSSELLPHKTEVFWSLTAAKPERGPNSPKHNLLQLPLHPTALTGDTCDLPGPPMCPTCPQGRLFPTRTSHWGFASRIWDTPRLNSILCTYWEFTRSAKGLATTDLQHYLLFLCSHPSAEQGPSSSCP